MMAKKLEKMLAILLALSMCMSLLSFQALAADGTETTSGTVEVESKPGGGTETVDVTITVKPNNTTEKETAEGGDTTESGLNVNFESTETKDDAGKVISGESSYNVTNSDGTYGAAGGSEIKTEQVSPGATVDVPLTTDDPDTKDVDEGTNTVTGNLQGGTVPTHEGDALKSENAAIYDQTTTTVAQQGSVSVTNNGITVTTGSGLGGEYESDKDIGLKPIASQWDDSKQNVRKPVAGLSDEELAALDKDRFLPAKPLTQEEIAAALKEKPEGYDYLYIGLGEDSYYGVGWNYSGENWGNTHGTGTHQFQLADFSGENVDPKVLEVISAYCADLETSSRKGYWYTVENVEDADYYNEESANHIRAIAANGYWGTVGTDEAGNPVTGSLEAVKQMMANAKDAEGNAVFTEDQIKGLTEGEALAASQMAVWKYGNPYQAEDMDIYLDADTLDYNNYQGIDAWREGDSTNELKDQGLTDEEIKAALARIDALADYLMSLSMTKEDAEKAGIGETDIIGETKFISDMSMTVGEKTKENADGNGNDAYNVDLTFSLVVTPSQENDDLIVKVINSEGKVVSTARIAGDGSKDEGFSQLTTTTDAAGKTHYTMTGLELVEGSNTKFNLKLEGAQYLEQGVYVYSSEIRDVEQKDGSTKEVPSQTFVGIAEGYKSVDVSMEIDLSFNVEEATITTERVWRTEWTDSGEDTGDDDIVIGDDDDDDDDDDDIVIGDDDDDDDDDIVIGDDDDDDDDDDFIELGEGDVPLADAEQEEIVDMIDEEVPLAEVPATGDPSALWLMLTALSGSGLVGLKLFEKKREEELNQ